MFGNLQSVSEHFGTSSHKNGAQLVTRDDHDHGIKFTTRPNCRHYCHVGNEPTDSKLGLFQDADFAVGFYRFKVYIVEDLPLLIPLVVKKRGVLYHVWSTHVVQYA